MNLRDFAERILRSDRLDDKLEAPPERMEDTPGSRLVLSEPARPPELRFDRRRHSVRMPRMLALDQERLRAVAHHVMANHELQALELMAWALLAFPDAPPGFRLGLTRIMRDEQEHTVWHIERARSAGLEFGDLPVNGYVWRRTVVSDGIRGYLASLHLTFENANLDHSLAYAKRFEEVGDRPAAKVMADIHRDEISHVAFGAKWLRRFSPGRSDWQAYLESLPHPLRPEHARGKEFDEHSRRSAGLSVEFVDRLGTTDS